MVVANVVDISRLKVKLNVSESDAFALKPGDVAEISTDVYPQVSYTGKIKSISTKADESHTYPVEVVFDNSSANPLKAGMFCRVKFKFKTGTEVLVIPREALVGSMKSPQVYVVDGPVARLRQITVDSEIGTSLAVRGGLREGETVVVSGQNNLKDSVGVTVMK
jgi:RND family efflux transporter MFP subunit